MEKLLSEVKYIPELKINLIFLRMLDKAGYCIKTEFGLLKVTKGSQTVMKGEIKNDLYKLIGKIVISETSSVENQNVGKVTLWHLRLEHISQEGLMELNK